MQCASTYHRREDKLRLVSASKLAHPAMKMGRFAREAAASTLERQRLSIHKRGGLARLFAHERRVMNFGAAWSTCVCDTKASHVSKALHVPSSKPGLRDRRA